MSNVPGSNLLKKAFKLIAKQEVIYYKFVSNTKNSIGMLDPSYDPPVVLKGSFQAMSSEQYDEFGINFQRVGVVFYTSNEIFPVNRNVSNDLLEFDSKKYEVINKTNWFNIDGWVGIAAVLKDNV